MKSLQEIKQMIDENRLEEAMYALNNYIASFPPSDEAYYMRGTVFNRLNDWKHSIQDYCEAIDINPNSSAVRAYEAAQEMLKFYHTDLYNP